jgi:hypothetical protein
MHLLYKRSPPYRLLTDEDERLLGGWKEIEWIV